MIKTILKLEPREVKEFTFESDKPRSLWRIATFSDEVKVLFVSLGSLLLFQREAADGRGLLLGSLVGKALDWGPGRVLRIGVSNTRDVATSFPLEVLTEEGSVAPPITEEELATAKEARGKLERCFGLAHALSAMMAGPVAQELQQLLGEILLQEDDPTSKTAVIQPGTEETFVWEFPSSPTWVESVVIKDAIRPEDFLVTHFAKGPEKLFMGESVSLSLWDGPQVPSLKMVFTNKNNLVMRVKNIGIVPQTLTVGLKIGGL